MHGWTFDGLGHSNECTLAMNRRPRPVMLRQLFAYTFLLITAASLSAADRVILISSDGTRPDAITALGKDKAPNWFRLREEGAYTDNARTDEHYTVTLPNHTCMVTGRGVVGKSGHEWTINSDPPLGRTLHRNHGSYVASMFDVAHDHGLKTGLFASKSKFSLFDNSFSERWGAEDSQGEDNGRDKVDVYIAGSDTDALIEDWEASMKANPLNLTMIHLRNPDSRGHAERWDLSKGSEYLDSIKEVDKLLGRVFAAVESNPDYKGQTWIIVTADHGGLTGTKGHGESDEPDNFNIPFYVWGPGVKAGADLYALNPENRKAPKREVNPEYDDAVQPIRNGDAGNLALKLLGMPAVPGSTINADQDLAIK